ncbi:MAG TPA: hypothetical protein VFE33_13365 [Thermoanaerobaculia bacterium]|nr:hypothetical protein [Thermoanaerobaculia bacterium]
MERRWWQVGTLLPMLMVVALAADLASRFLPLDLVAFRVWEPALQIAPGAPGPFEPGKVVTKRRAYGDLTAIGNYRRLREYHDESFHVDRLGFRNACDVDHTVYAGIVTGDSFAVGHAEPEPATLSGRLSLLAGARFYNAGASLLPGPPLPDVMASLAATLRIHRGLVVYELLERGTRFPPLPQVDSPVAPYPPVPPDRSFGRWLQGVARRFAPTVESPLRVAGVRLVKWLENDSLRPNAHARAAAHRQLPNGDEMLFLPRDLAPLGAGEVPPLAAAWSSYLAWYAGKLRGQGLRFVVLLVPDKYTVYGPLTPNEAPKSEGGRLLAAIEDRLRSAGVPVVNVTALFRARAAEALSRHEYLYWRDDTHWNARGIELAADAVWREVR